MNNNGLTARTILFILFILLWSLLWTLNKSEFIIFQKKLDYFYYLFGLVPAIGLLAGFLIFRKSISNSAVSLFGKEKISSIVAILIPTVLLTIVGVSNTYQIQENIFGFYAGCIVLLYALMEEYGWRGYLHPALFSIGLKKWMVYIITGGVWYLWHWFFLRSGLESSKIILLPLLIIASAGLDAVLQKTKSILWCGAFHGLANILFMYSLVSNSLTSVTKVSIAISCIIVWSILFKRIKE